jgi:hypothetical protein
MIRPYYDLQIYIMKYKKGTKISWDYPLKYLWLTHPKKVEIRPWSGSDQRGLDPTGSGSATLLNNAVLYTVQWFIKFKFKFCVCLLRSRIYLNWKTLWLPLWTKSRNIICYIECKKKLSSFVTFTWDQGLTKLADWNA